ncbi:MAG: Cache 3/Cache 2 fusion domain-containing protein [Planctomycetota bacterium]
MKLETKLFIVYMSVILLASIVIVGTVLNETQVLKEHRLEEIDKEIRNLAAGVVQPVYEMYRIQEERVNPQLDKDLKNARYLIDVSGSLTLSEDRIPWEVIDPLTGKTREIELPMMLLGNRWLEMNADPKKRSPIVDDIKKLTGSSCEIYQRVNEEGDMVCICTSELNRSGYRGIGNYLNDMRPDGSVNHRISTIMTGEKYVERVAEENGWMTVLSEPLLDEDGSTVIGMISVGLHVNDLIDSLRKTITKLQLGKTGYVWVLGSQGEQRGRYIVSKDSKRDGEYIWESRDDDGRFFVQSIIHKALDAKPGEVSYERYPWKNEGEVKPRWKISALTYFEPWEWVIGASVYEEDFEESRHRIESQLEEILWIILGIEAALILCATGVGYLIFRAIRQFRIEGEHQDWSKTGIGELATRIRGQQDIDLLGDSILTFFGLFLDVLVGTLSVYNEDEMGVVRL